MARSVFLFIYLYFITTALWSETPVTVTFQNQTTGSVEVLWVDFAGIERSFGKIEEGQMREQGTYPGHVWRFKQGKSLLASYTVAKEAHQNFGILVRSLQSNTAVAVKFRNGTYKPVDLIWVDPSGVEKPFGTLFPGEERVESTFASHIWRFRQGDIDAGLYTITDESGQEYTARVDPPKTIDEDPIHSARHWDTAPPENDVIRRYSYAVTVESMECSAIDRDEPGSENEIFGKLWVNFIVPDTQPQRLPDYVWDVDSKKPLSLKKGNASELQQTVKVEGLTASGREAGYVVVQGDLWEKDAKWGPFGGSDNDHLGLHSSKPVPLRDVGAKSKHSVRFRQGRDEITVHFSVEPLR